MTCVPLLCLYSGYMAPEYAIWGHLSYKVDVYSFGIVTLEIISGRSNSCYVPTDDFFCLLDWVWSSFFFQIVLVHFL